MGIQNLRRQVAGLVQAILGRILRTWGKLFGEPKAQMKGAAKELSGGATYAGGEVSEEMERQWRKASGAIRRNGEKVFRR
jgi:uncharacterized protein YjbJ (UPF0337 family)